jgi:hypothetical protein
MKEITNGIPILRYQLPYTTYDSHDSPPAKSQKFATPEQPQPAVADPNIACIILKLP